MFQKKGVGTATVNTFPSLRTEFYSVKRWQTVCMVLQISLDFTKRNLNVLVTVGSISSERFSNNHSIFFLIIISCHTVNVHPTMWKGHLISVLGHSFSKCSSIWKIKELLEPVKQQKPCKTTLQWLLWSMICNNLQYWTKVVGTAMQ